MMQRRDFFRSLVAAIALRKVPVELATPTAVLGPLKGRHFDLIMLDDVSPYMTNPGQWYIVGMPEDLKFWWMKRDDS